MEPYDTNYNRANIMMGSEGRTTYLNVDFYLN